MVSKTCFRAVLQTNTTSERTNLVTSTKTSKTTSAQKTPVEFGYPAKNITILFVGLNKTGKKAGGGRLMFKDSSGVTKVFLPRLNTQPDRVIRQLVDSLVIPKGGVPATVNWAEGEIEIVIDA